MRLRFFFFALGVVVILSLFFYFSSHSALFQEGGILNRTYYLFQCRQAGFDDLYVYKTQRVYEQAYCTKQVDDRSLIADYYVVKDLQDEYSGLNVSSLQLQSLLTLGEEQTVQDKREEALDFIYRTSRDTITDVSVRVDVTDPRYRDVSFIKSITLLNITMEYGIESLVYHFRSSHPNGYLVLYHEGHRGDFILGNDTISALLGEGYDVLAFSLPLLGINNQPTVTLPRFGPVRLYTHDHLKLLDSDTLHPLKFFYHPVYVALEYAQQFDYRGIFMVGISGGGWATTLAAALDPRILRSYPVAGSSPFHLKFNRDWGDYEQNDPSFYSRFTYLDLYLMGAYEEGRAQLQIFNKYDTCCFAGERSKSYETFINSRTLGDFRVFIDDTHAQHQISPHALQLILDDMASYRAQRK